MHLVVEPFRNMRSTSAGFTLIEMLVVVAMVAVVAGASAPIIGGGMARYSLTTTGQQIASTIRSARFQAVGRNTSVRVVFDADAGTFEKEAWDPDTMSWVDIDTALTLPSGVSFADGIPANLEFESDGRLPAGAVATAIGIVDDYAETRTITVQPNGRIQLQ
jgi:prepilin-type N-terminal cleavage/methylation domain-containing protein